MKKYFIFIFMIVFSIHLSCQNSSFRITKFEQNKRYLNGFSLGLGASIGDFLNTKFQNQLKSDNIKINPGFVLEAKYIFYPLIINSTLFGNNFSLGKNNNIKNGVEVKIKHTGIEGGVSVALMPFTKILTPYVGVGYQYGIIGSGISWLGIEDKDNADILSVTNASTLVFKSGFCVNINQFHLNLDYHKGLDNNLNFNQFSATISFTY